MEEELQETSELLALCGLGSVKLGSSQEMEGRRESQSAAKGFQLHGKCSCFTSFYLSMFSNPWGPGVQDPERRVPRMVELFLVELSHPWGSEFSG